MDRHSSQAIESTAPQPNWPEVIARCERFFAAHAMTPTAVQRAAMDTLDDSADVLFVAPTGSGKTLAAFLPLAMGLDRAESTSVRVLYLAPTRALVQQQGERLTRVLEEASAYTSRPLRLGVRTGDSTAAERSALTTHPPDVLVCTPESLAIVLGTPARTALTTVRDVVLDEAHLLAEGKRGALLASTLETLTLWLERSGGTRPRRIALSATVNPIEALAAWIGGDHKARICIAGEPTVPDIELITPGFDAPFPSAGWAGRAMLPAIARHIATPNGTTLVFVPSRPVAEHWTQALRDVLPARFAIACFHGSMAHDERTRAGVAHVRRGTRRIRGSWRARRARRAARRRR